jgi:muconolactone delta-isomerase
MNTHALTEKAMVMNLSISLWQGYRLDKEASRKVTTDNGADSDAARVNKHLVPKDYLAPVVTAANNVRSHFYQHTLPWRDNGDRLMTRQLYMQFIEAHENLVTMFKDAVATFLDDKYPSAIAKAEFRMGTLFKRDDYPSASELRHKFRIGLDIDAVTTANDFRVQIDADQVERVKASMEAAAEARVNTAMQDVWKRLAETIGVFADRLSNPDAKLYDSAITNVEDLIELIPGLNVIDNPEIEEIRLAAKAKLTGVEAKDIRKDPALRAELGGEAKEIVDKMAGFMKAFGAGER